MIPPARPAKRESRVKLRINTEARRLSQRGKGSYPTYTPPEQCGLPSVVSRSDVPRGFLTPAVEPRRRVPAKLGKVYRASERERMPETD